METFSLSLFQTFYVILVFSGGAKEPVFRKQKKKQIKIDGSNRQSCPELDQVLAAKLNPTGLEVWRFWRLVNIELLIQCLGDYQAQTLTDFGLVKTVHVKNHDIKTSL